MHTETSNLGKAKKMLQEVSEAKRAHKQAWTQHLAESTELWQKQLQEFTQQQALLAEKESKATRDIQAANKAIQSLNQQAAGSGPVQQTVAVEPVPPVQPESTPAKEKEIIEMQKRLQKGLNDCAVAAGLKINKSDIQEVDDSEDEEQAKKRQRSQERQEDGS